MKKRKKKRSTNPAVRVLKILGTALLSIFLILIITCSIFATVLTIYVLNFADTTTTISLDKTETSNISRFLSVNPDYDEDDLKEAFQFFSTRERRFGMTSAQVQNKDPNNAN